MLAAKGSPLQSILANVYHVDVPTGNIKVHDAERIIKNPMVERAIPLAYGDNFEKWRIVGTNPFYSQHYGCTLQEGRLFELPFEATIGALVAKETGLKIGSAFTSSHGFDNANAEGNHHDKPYTVVGIFEQSGCVIDNLLLTPMESTWMVHEGHDEEEQKENLAQDAETNKATGNTIEPEDVNDTDTNLPDQNKSPTEGLSGDEVMKQMAAESKMIMPGQGKKKDDTREMTAYLIIKRNRGAFGLLSNMTKDTNMELVNVAVQNNRLLNNFGIGMDTVFAIAILISIISFISIFISLYNSLKERKYELALMRTMGGTRAKLFSLIMLEGLLLVVLGYVLGLILSRIGLYILGHYVQDNFHYNISDMGITPPELVLLSVTLLVGVVASLLPAWRALQIDISKTLSNG